MQRIQNCLRALLLIEDFGIPTELFKRIHELAKHISQLLILLVGGSVPTGLNHQFEYLAKKSKHRLSHPFYYFWVFQFEDVGGDLDNCGFVLNRCLVFGDESAQFKVKHIGVHKGELLASGG